MITLEDIKQHKISKKVFAKRLKLTERKVQAISNELYEFMLSKEGEITPAEYVVFASDETKMAYQQFNWEKSDEYRLALADEALSLIKYIVIEDNKLLKITRIET